MKSKAILFLLSLMLVIGLCTACGESKESADSADAAPIKDAQTLSEANKAAQEAVNSFHVDSDISMNMTVAVDTGDSSGKQDIEMPMQTKLNLDCGKESAHGQSDATMTLMGQAQSQSLEVYCDLANGVVYSKEEGSDSWTKTEDENITGFMNSFAEMDDSVISKGEVAESEEGYTLTLSAEALGDYIKEMGLMDSLEQMDLNNLDLSGGSIVYTFDKETTLVKTIKMDHLKLEASGLVQGVDCDIDIDIDGGYDFSKYDELNPADYTIPDEISKKAN